MNGQVVLPLAKTSQAKYKCFYCGKEYVESNYYKSHSNFFSSIGKIPYCKHCIEKFYQYYYDKYNGNKYKQQPQKSLRKWDRN